MRYFFISLLAFVLLAVPAFAWNSADHDVVVTVTISEILEWDYAGGPAWGITIDDWGDYQTTPYLWDSGTTLINIRSNTDWHLAAVRDAWSMTSGELSMDDWVVKGQWDGETLQTITTTAVTLYDGVAGYDDSKKLKMELHGVSADDGWGVGTTTVTFSLVKD